MTMGYAVDNLAEYLSGLAFRQASLLLDKLEQIAPSCILKHHVHVVARLEDLQQANDVLVSDGGHQGHFTAHFFNLTRLQRCLVNHLYCNWFLSQSLDGKSDFAEGTLAYNRLHSIASERAREVHIALLLGHVVLADGKDQ